MVYLFCIAVLSTGQQVAPVSIGKLTSYPGGLVSRDGSYWYGSGWARVDLKSGKWYSEGWLRAGLFKGDPPIPFARTENQAHYDMVAGFGSPNKITHTEQTGEKQYASDALNGDRLLMYTEPRLATEVNKYVVLTEFHLDSRRDGTKNVCWLLALPSLHATTVGARYLDEASFEVWVVQPGQRNWAIVRYVGQRGDPKAGLRRDRRVELVGFPASEEGPGGWFVPNSFEPDTGRFVLGRNSFNSYDLVDARGDVKASYTPEPDPSRGRSGAYTLAVWHLTVSDKSVPGGKSAWRPIARSADGKHWLVREAAGKDHKLIKLK